jgi:hypothetical protein
MAAKSEDAKARAEAQFRKREQRSHEAEQVRVENVAKAHAVDEKTARLKGLRLARDVAEQKAAAEAEAKPEPVKKRARKVT